MKIFYFAAALLLEIALILPLANSAKAAPTARGAVEILNEGILKHKTDDSALFKAIEKSFDLDRIAVLSIGRSRWQKWNNAERIEYTKAFTSYLLAIYQNRFRDYDGEGMNIYKTQAKKNRALVYTQIKPKVDDKIITSNKPINIDFSVYNKKRGGKDYWLINDVYFKGTISEVAGFRASFSTLLKEKGRTGLIAEMKTKCKAQGKFCRWKK